LSDEPELAGDGPVVFMAGSDELLGVADVFDIQADADIVHEPLFNDDATPRFVELVTWTHSLANTHRR
jgi:hypothetical protein